MMDNEDTLRRLKSIEGHVRGIERMVGEDAYCIDVIRQIQAVQAALDKVSSLLLEKHLHSCLITAVRGDNPEDRERVLMEISDDWLAGKRKLNMKAEMENENKPADSGQKNLQKKCCLIVFFVLTMGFTYIIMVSYKET